MPDTINVHEAKTHLSKLLERVKAGEEIVLAKGGEPYAKLVPLERKPREFGFVEGSVPASFFEPLSDDELEVWE